MRVSQAAGLEAVIPDQQTLKELLSLHPIAFWDL